MKGHLNSDHTGRLYQVNFLLHPFHIHRILVSRFQHFSGSSVLPFAPNMKSRPQAARAVSEEREVWGLGGIVLSIFLRWGKVGLELWKNFRKYEVRSVNSEMWYSS